MKNEQGITLVELLAAITIFMVISGLFYNVFSNSINNYNNIEKRINAQQEANVIMSALTQIHQTSSEYTISRINPYQLQVEYTPEPTTGGTSDKKRQLLGNDKYEIQLQVTALTTNNTCSLIQTTTNNTCISINLKLDTSTSVKLTMTNKDNKKDTFTINTTISRYAKSK